ncbi:MAG: hypothetical protein AB8B61_07005 [Cyclobacteriaceae bacterium]
MKNCIFLIVAIVLATNCSHAQDNKITIGIHRTNMSWTKRDKYKELLDGMKAIGARNVRLSSIKGRGRIETILNHIAYANSIDLEVLLIIALPNNSYYDQDTQKKPKINGGKIYAALDVNHEKYKSHTAQLFQGIKERNLKVKAFEVFNEVNWTDFNSDLPNWRFSKEVTKGTGLVFNSKTKMTPMHQHVIKAMLNYGELLQTTIDLRDQYFTNKERPKIVSSGIVIDYTGVLFDKFVTRGLTCVDPLYFIDLLSGKTKHSKVDYLKSIDAFGVHYYPKKTLSYKTAVQEVKNRIRPICKRIDKKVWITEWDVKAEKHYNHDENVRYKVVKWYIDATKKVTPSVSHVYLFSYDQMRAVVKKDGTVSPVAGVFDEYK